MLDIQKLNEIAETLQGTCGQYNYLLDDLSIAELSYIESSYIQCTNCGWWVDAGEIAGDDGECIDCYEE